MGMIWSEARIDQDIVVCDFLSSLTLVILVEADGSNQPVFCMILSSLLWISKGA